MTKTQEEILQRINERLERGDIKTIAAESGYTRETVGKVLNKDNDWYNQKIVDAAVKVLNKKEAVVKSSLKTLAA